jgi:CheY-like chemotaxis protein
MSGRLLLVDDDDDIRAIAGMALERVGGWTVVAAPSGAAAIEIVEADPGFDGVLLDVMMPGLDGPTTLHRLRDGLLPDSVPVIFLTAKIQPTDRAELEALGAAGVIAKPFDPMGLSDDVRQLIDGA